MIRGNAIKLDRRFKQRAAGRFEKWEFEVGILKDSSHKLAQSKNEGLKEFAGGPARKQSRTSTMSMSELSKELRDKIGTNFYTEPFKSSSNKEILAFTDSFFKVVSNSDGKKKRRATNLLQAIVRNPILRGEYGTNSAVTQDIKGFNRFMIDTGQFFKAITAKLTNIKGIG